MITLKDFFRLRRYYSPDSHIILRDLHRKKWPHPFRHMILFAFGNFLVNTIIFYVTSKKCSENILDSHSGGDMISFRSQRAQDPPCYTLVAQGP